MNRLYYGDNLDVMRRYLPDQSIDLVYLDPPFNSNATYNVLFGAKDASTPSAQIRAFDDTWHWDRSAQDTFDETLAHGGQVAQALQALDVLLGPSNMLAYLAMMAPRLVELRRVLKPTGSIYLHCDPTASHYLKLLMDAVFGPEHFRNEVIWQRTAAKGDARRKFGSVHDSLFVYVGGPDAYFEPARREPDAEYLARFALDDNDGRGPYRLAPLDSPNPRPNLTYEYKGFQPPAKGWRVNLTLMEKLDAEGRLAFPAKAGGRIARKHYLEEQEWPRVGDVWTDIAPLQAASAERLGYPTQKPVSLLTRIIEASSRPGDVVLDPFCGCGTTIDAAQRLGRPWIGIDVTHLAIGLIKTRLADTYGEGSNKAQYEVVGEPADVESATQLASEDRFQFQAWALGLVGARTEDSSKKGADKGIDGKLFFRDEGKIQNVILSVKSGKLKATDVRDLRAVVDRESAAIGVLLCLDSPSKPMRTEAVSAGNYEGQWGQFPKLQILEVGDLLSDKARLQMPPRGTQETFKTAPKSEPAPQGKQLGLDG